MTGMKGRGRGFIFLKANVGFAGEECLIWPFGQDQDGYGRFGYNGKILKAHRWMCEAIHGAPPTPGHYAAHECGNGRGGCVHPKHVSWKTHAENTEDMMRHGTYRKEKGGDRSKRKLDREKVAYIRAAKGEKTIAELAEMFGVSYRQITKIQQGISWAEDSRPERVFTPDEIRAIRHAKDTDTTQADLARRYGVSHTVIWRIQHCLTYLHVPTGEP